MVKISSNRNFVYESRINMQNNNVQNKTKSTKIYDAQAPQPSEPAPQPNKPAPRPSEIVDLDNGDTPV